MFRLEVKEKTFTKTGDIKIKCTATIHTIYWRSNEESIQVPATHYLHIIYTISTHYLHDIYTLSTYYLHIVCTLSTLSTPRARPGRGRTATSGTTRRGSGTQVRLQKKVKGGTASNETKRECGSNFGKQYITA